jgi:protein translocase SecG subunit
MMMVSMIIEVIVGLLLIGVILMQRQQSDGLSGLSGAGTSMGGAFSQKSVNRFILRLTAWLVGIFFANTLWLGRMTYEEHRQLKAPLEKTLQEVLKGEPEVPHASGEVLGEIPRLKDAVDVPDTKGMAPKDKQEAR